MRHGNLVQSRMLTEVLQCRCLKNTFLVTGGGRVMLERSWFCAHSGY